MYSDVDLSVLRIWPQYPPSMASLIWRQKIFSLAGRSDRNQKLNVMPFYIQLTLNVWNPKTSFSSWRSLNFMGKNRPLKWGGVYVVRSWSWNSDLSIQSKSAAFDSTKTTKFRFFNFHFFYPSLLMCFFSSFTFPWPFALKSGSAKKS